MKIDREPYSEELRVELMPLAQKCWDSESETKAKTCAYYGERNFAIAPDIATYKKFADADVLVIVTLRDNLQLVGYAIGFVYQSLHHKVLCACGDSFYVEPEYRSYGGALEDRFEKEFVKMNAEIIGWGCTPGGPVHTLLIAKGFIADDIVMEKRLCVSH
jgi:hypothetical protein